MSDVWYFDSDTVSFSFRFNACTGVSHAYICSPWQLVVDCGVPTWSVSEIA